MELHQKPGGHQPKLEGGGAAPMVPTPMTKPSVYSYSLIEQSLLCGMWRYLLIMLIV